MAKGDSDRACTVVTPAQRDALAAFETVGNDRSAFGPVVRPTRDRTSQGPRAIRQSETRSRRPKGRTRCTPVIGAKVRTAVRVETTRRRAAAYGKRISSGGFPAMNPSRRRSQTDSMRPFEPSEVQRQESDWSSGSKSLPADIKSANPVVRRRIRLEPPRLMIVSRRLLSCRWQHGNARGYNASILSPMSRPFRP